MTERTSIVVPVDFSENAGWALQVAIHLAKQNNAHVYVYTRVDIVPGYSGSNSSLYSDLIFNSKEDVYTRFQKFLDEHSIDIMDYTYISESVDIIEGLNSLIEKENIGMVVLGSKGTSNFKGWMIGSTAQRLIRDIEIPCLVIKSPTTLSQINNVLFISNLNVESREILERARYWIELISKPKYHILHVKKPSLFSDPQIITLTGLSNLTKGLDIDYKFYHPSSISIEKALDKLAAKIDPDLIIIGTYGRSHLSRIFKRSLTEALINHVNYPILTVGI